MNKTSSLSISSHITRSSPDHLGQSSLTQSLLSQRAQTGHRTPDMSLSTQERNITLPSPCWLCLCWYSPAGEAGLQCHKDTLLRHVLLPAPCKSFHAASPQPVLLHSCHIPGAGSEPLSALLQPLRVPWTHCPVLRFISHCPPSQLPAQTCWDCTGASVSQNYKGFLSEIKKSRCKISQKPSTKGCHFPT